MPTLQEVKNQINALECKYIFYTKKEVNYLPEIMIEGEIIKAVTSGFHGNRTVLAVCTNRRLLFLDKGMFFGLRQWQLGLDRIQSIDGDYKILMGSIRVWDGASPIKMDLVLASCIDPFIKATRQAIDDFKRISFQETVGASHRQPEKVDVASQIEKLAALKDAGHLTEKEFETQKKKLLQLD